MVGQHQRVDAVRELRRWLTDTYVHLELVRPGPEGGHERATRLALLQVVGERRQADRLLEELPQQELGGRQHHGAHPDDRQLGQDGLAGLHLRRLKRPGRSGCVETINTQSAEAECGHAERGDLTDRFVTRLKLSH